MRTSFLDGFVALMQQTGYRALGATDWSVPASVAALQRQAHGSPAPSVVFVKAVHGVMVHHRMAVEPSVFEGPILRGSFWWVPVPWSRHAFHVLRRLPRALRWLGFGDSPRFERPVQLPRRVARGLTAFSDDEIGTQRALATPGVAEAMFRLPYMNLFVDNGRIEFNDFGSKVAYRYDPMRWMDVPRRNERYPMLFLRDLTTMIEFYRIADAQVTDLVVRTAYALG